MIGTKIRGFHHFFRVVKTLKQANFFFKHEPFSIDYGTALFVENGKVRNNYMSSSADYFMLFNTQVSNVKFNPDHYKKNEDETAKEILKLWEKYMHVWVIPSNQGINGDARALFSDKIIVPEDFEKNFSEFCEANKKQTSQLSSKFAPIDFPIFKYLYAISSGSKNFFFWAANAYFKQKVSIHTLEKIMNWNDGYSQLAKNLKKGTITAYTNGNDILSVLREMAKLRRDKRANDVINMFNTAQKKILRAATLSDKDYETLSKFGKLSIKKKLNFIKKMSTVEDPVEILRQMSFLADVHFEWKKESLIDFIKNSENFNCEIVIDKGNILLVKVKDYETVKRLAKTTNWCISKDKKYWNEYVEAKPNATQYVIFDFSRKEDDKLSIVGFTSVHDRGITNAHDFENKNLMTGRRMSTVNEIKSFVSKYIDCSSIYGILDKDGIKISDVVTYEPSKYDWNAESMFEYLNRCIDEDDYYVIYDDNNKVVFIAENDNIKYFLGDAFMCNNGENSANEYIVFADFNKSKNDPERLAFGMITHNYKEHESSCSNLFNYRFEPINKSFDSMLEEYNLPYDVICRTDNTIERFYSSYYNLELASVKDLIKDKKVIDSIKEHDRSDIINEQLINVTFSYNSADYVDLFYNAGLTLSDAIGSKRTGDFARRLINSMFDSAGHDFSRMIVPTEKDIEDLYNGNFEENHRKAMYVGNFIILMKVIEKEPNVYTYTKVASLIHERHTVCDLFDLIFTRICDLLEMNDDENFDVFKYIAAYAYNIGSPRMVSVFENHRPKNHIASFIAGYRNYKSKATTETWVIRDGSVYTLQTINEEAIAHAPRRR